MEVSAGSAPSANPGNASGSGSQGEVSKPAGGAADHPQGKHEGAVKERHGTSEKSDADEKPDGEGKEAPAAKKADEKPQPKKYRLPKDDGGEEEVDEAEVKRRIVHSREANKRMEEAALARRQMEQFIEQFSEDPIGLLEHLAQMKKLKHDPIELMEQRLAKHYQRQLMTPEQITAEENERKAKAYEEWQQQQVKAAEEAKLAEAVRHYSEDYDNKITAVLNASGLPKTTGAVKRVAALMEVAIQKGYEPDLNYIVEKVKSEYHGDTKSLYAQMSGDELIQHLGEEIANKIRKADLARLRQIKQQEPPKEAPKPRAPKEKERYNPREFFEQAMRRQGMKG